MVCFWPASECESWEILGVGEHVAGEVNEWMVYNREAEWRLSNFAEVIFCELVLRRKTRKVFKEIKKLLNRSQTFDVLLLI